MNILINLYSVHQNVLGIAVLLLFLIIFFALKKNFKVMIPTLIIFLVFNVFCFKQTTNQSWERQFLLSDEYPKSFLIFENTVDSIKTVELVDSSKYVFSAISKETWVLNGIDSTHTTHLLHWCWVDDYFESFSNTDLVAWIWGENAGKKVRGSSEKRLNMEIN